MRVATYNIHGAVGRDNIHNLVRIEDIIEEIKPNIIGIQEVEYRDLEELKRTADPFPNVELNTLFIPTIQEKTRYFGNALLTSYPIIKHIDVKLENSDLSIRVEKRRAIFALLQIEERKVWVIVSHVAPQKKYRKLQGQALFKAMREHINFAKEECMVLMDFNEWYRPSELLSRMDRLFPHHLAKTTFPTFLPLFKIDRIWTTQGLKPQKFWVHKSEKSRIASDHYPLCADLIIN